MQTTQDITREAQINFDQGLRRLETTAVGLPFWVWIIIIIVILIILWAVFMRKDEALIIV